MSPSVQSFEFVTDTSTICVFDVAALGHRLDDDPDWWCYPAPQIEELNAGNAVFLDVGRDGRHVGTLRRDPLEAWQYQLWLRAPSGRIFIGAGEEATSDGMEPDCTRGGLMLEVPVGAVQLRLRMSQSSVIELSLCPSTELSSNSFLEPLCLRDPA